MAVRLERQPGTVQGEHLPTLLEVLTRMARTLRAASFPADAKLAAQVLHLDGEVDRLYGQAQLLARGPLPDALAAGQCWRAAERLGDHLKNVANRLPRLVS